MQSILKEISPKDLKQLTIVGQAVAKARERIDDVINRVLDSSFQSEDPAAAIQHFEDYVADYSTRKRIHTPVAETPKPKSERLPRDGYKKRQNQLESMVYAFHNSNPEATRTGLKVADFLKYPGVNQLYDSNPKSALVSMGKDLKVIMKRSGARINRNETTKLYSVSPQLSYEMIANAADKIYEREKVVTTPHIKLELNLQEQERKVGSYLARWAKEKGLDSEHVSMGRQFGQTLAYFKGTRPPVSPSEKVKATLGDLETVTHAYLREQTGFMDKTIITVMGQLKFSHKGAIPDRTYERQ